MGPESQSAEAETAAVHNPRREEGHVGALIAIGIVASLLGIGLGLLTHGASRHGQRVRACDPVRDGDVLVDVCDPVFYDPAGEHLRG